MLEQLGEHHVEVDGVILEATEDHKPEVVGCLEHIKPVLVGLEVVELHIVLLRGEGPAQPTDLHGRADRIHYSGFFVEEVVVVHGFGVVAQFPVVQQPVHVVEDQELVDQQVVI